MSSLNNLTVKHYSKENLYLQIIKFFKSKNRNYMIEDSYKIDANNEVNLYINQILRKS